MFFIKYIPKKGCVSVLLLSVSSLMISGFISVALIGIGIKNITYIQSSCIIININGQKALGHVLNQLVKINNTVVSLHNTRRNLETRLAMARSLKNIPLILLLRNKIESVKHIQRSIIFKQKQLLAESSVIRRKMFLRLKDQLKSKFILFVYDITSHKKPLAIERKKIGNNSYIYNPQSDFTYKQKTEFSFELDVFFPLGHYVFFKKFSTYHTCVASLQKSSGGYKSILYH